MEKPFFASLAYNRASLVPFPSTQRSFWHAGMELEPPEKLLAGARWLYLICDVNCIDLHNVFTEVLFYLPI